MELKPQDLLVLFKRVANPVDAVVGIESRHGWSNGASDSALLAQAGRAGV
jgi:hypothetical protein